MGRQRDIEGSSTEGEKEAPTPERQWVEGEREGFSTKHDMDDIDVREFTEEHFHKLDSDGTL